MVSRNENKRQRRKFHPFSWPTVVKNITELRLRTLILNSSNSVTLANLSGWTRQYLSYKISSFIVEAFIKGLCQSS